MKTIPPNSIIGILGGGQLGRMTALAAAKLGYRCHIFCADENEPAVSVSAFHTKAAFDDRAALIKFAQSVDVATLEWENVPIEALDIVAQHTGMHPGANALRVAQDREQEKTFARNLGIGTADFVIVRSAAELAQALKTFPLPAILKSTRMGYDGKGQVTLNSADYAEQAWSQMGGDVGILESFVDFVHEISVIVAARADGVMVAFPAAENIHRDHILSISRVPAMMNGESPLNIEDATAVVQDATHAACLIAKQLGVVGLLAVEFFVLRAPDAQGRQILMNEIAPRPHNSGHWTMDGCHVSQFEQLVRAICGLPLGDPTPHSQVVMHNLIGDQANQWPQLLADPNASLHLYGKKEVRAGRKMGHVNVVKEFR